MGNSPSNTADEDFTRPYIPKLALRTKTHNKGSSLHGVGASAWSSVICHADFREFALAHLQDSAFVQSVLDANSSSSSSTSAVCASIAYFKSLEPAERTALSDRVTAFMQVAAAGMEPQIAGNSAFDELQLARASTPGAFLPVLQRRLCLLRALAIYFIKERLSYRDSYVPRLRAPPNAASSRQGDVNLAITFESVALSSLASLAQMLPMLQAAGNAGGAALVRQPFELLGRLLLQFEARSLFRHWSPLPCAPEQAAQLASATARATVGTAVVGQARLAVTGGLSTAWKSGSSGSSSDHELVWQVQLAAPVHAVTAVEVQWAAGEAAAAFSRSSSSSSSDNSYITPIALTIELGVAAKPAGSAKAAASASTSFSWHNACGKGGLSIVEVDQVRKSCGSRHRYSVDAGIAGGAPVAAVKLRMRGRCGAAGPTTAAVSIDIYDVAVKVPDESLQVRCYQPLLRHRLDEYLLALHDGMITAGSFQCQLTA
jgi:hypothetical protein